MAETRTQGAKIMGRARNWQNSWRAGVLSGFVGGALASGCASDAARRCPEAPSNTDPAHAAALSSPTPDAGGIAATPPAAHANVTLPADAVLRSDAAVSLAFHNAQRWRGTGAFARIAAWSLGAYRGLSSPRVEASAIELLARVAAAHSAAFPAPPELASYFDRLVAFSAAHATVDRNEAETVPWASLPVAREFDALVHECPEGGMRDRTVYDLQDVEGVPGGTAEEIIERILRDAGFVALTPPAPGSRSTWVFERAAGAVAVARGEHTLTVDTYTEPTHVCHSGRFDASAFAERARRSLGEMQSSTTGGSGGETQPAVTSAQFEIRPAAWAHVVASQRLAAAFMMMAPEPGGPALDAGVRLRLVYESVNSVREMLDVVAPGGHEEFSRIAGGAEFDPSDTMELRATPSDPGAMFRDATAWAPYAAIAMNALGMQGFVRASSAWLRSSVSRFDPRLSAEHATREWGSLGPAVVPRALISESNGLFAAAGAPGGGDWSLALGRFESVGVASVGLDEPALVAFGVLPQGATAGDARCLVSDARTRPRCQRGGAGVIAPDEVRVNDGLAVRYVQLGSRWIVISSRDRAAAAALTFDALVEQSEPLSGSFPLSVDPDASASDQSGSALSLRTGRGAFSLGRENGDVLVRFTASGER